jgi:hypothetical protein
MVEAYTDSSLPSAPEATTASCSTKPRSVCTGPPWKTGVRARSSRSSGRSTFSNRFFSLMSLGLLITRPEGAAGAVLAQVDDAAGEGLVLQARHGDQEMMRQVDGRGIGGHDRILAEPMEKPYPAGLVWFRRDLRVPTTPRCTTPCAVAGRCTAPSSSTPTSCPACRARTAGWSSSASRWCSWTRRCGRWQARPPPGSSPCTAPPAWRFLALAKSLGVQAVFANRDYEPAAMARDAQVRGALADAGIAIHDSKDQAIFDRDELLTQAGRPTRCSPPTRTPGWPRSTTSTCVPIRSSGTRRRWRPAPRMGWPVPPLAKLGFEATNLALPVPVGATGGAQLLDDFLPASSATRPRATSRPSRARAT